MNALDWWVIAGYLVLMLGAAIYLGWRQQSPDDYFLGGQRLPSWALATSIIATQCSTNSLLGAPAFVGFVIGGGLLWLQYELAVPLAMLLLCYAFLPLRRAGVISIYAFLEQRLGLASRLLASTCFLLFRGVATGVTVYGVASVIELVTGLPFWLAVTLLMGITIAYDVLGGMAAVVVSDVMQLLLLLAAVFLALYWLWDPAILHSNVLATRGDALLNDWGLQSGTNYGFWPMLIGGFFLYTAYYGCDQSQAQRLLSAASERDTQRVLLLNGLLRFPLVMSYCLLGLGLAFYAQQHPDFIPSLPRTDSGGSNLNLVFPTYVLREFPAGLTGLVIVGLLAAAMSSIDSALNSLSASTLEDFYRRFRPAARSPRQDFLAAKLVTLAWGLFVVMLSFQVESIAPTVLEAINKVGSMANGPLLALFAVALFAPRLGQPAAIAGFACGLLANLLAARLLPEMSWLWWNPLGFACSLAVSAMVSLLGDGSAPRRPAVATTAHITAVPLAYPYALLGMAGLIAAICILFTVSA